MNGGGWQAPDDHRNQAPEEMIVAIEDSIRGWLDPKTPRAALQVANAAWNELLKLGILKVGHEPS